MDLVSVLHMTNGIGKTSYAKNSQFQRNVILKAKPFVQDTVADFCHKNLPKCLTIADLGCSSGPNTLVVIHEIIDAIASLCKRMNHSLPEFQVFLNDLVLNDFNAVFQSVPSFIEKLKKEVGDDLGSCFISGMPGSFHGRLFPSETLHFVHSSYALHYLSKVPQEIGNNNKGNIYIAKTAPPHVIQAYLRQFEKDFTMFLGSRSHEIVAGGRMVLTLIGRRSPDPTSDECCKTFELLAESLRDMVSEGLVEEAKLDSFNTPHYFPSREELKSVIQGQGSFNLDLLETFDVQWEPDNVFDQKGSGQNISRFLRAVLESIIVNHFGKEIIENLFNKYAEHLDEYMAEEKGYNVNYVNHVMCLSRRN